MEIGKSIMECFNKHYGNTISETSKAAVNVHMQMRGIVSYLMSVKFLTVMFGLIQQKQPNMLPSLQPSKSFLIASKKWPFLMV